MLRRLDESHSEFVLVGGLAAVLSGVPIQTYDVDVAYSRNPENIKRLLDALVSLDAVFRLHPERRLKPNAGHLSGAGHLNLLTIYGPLDLLATIGRDLACEDLLPHCSVMRVGEGFQIQVLDLEMLIELKEQLRGEKDLAVLPILHRMLEESKNRKTVR